MPHLSIDQRTCVIGLMLTMAPQPGDIYKTIAAMADVKFSIKISASGVRRLVAKWKETCSVVDRPRSNNHQVLISDAGILALNRELQSDPCLTASKLKDKLKLIASLRTITRTITHIGWKKVRTRYTQTVRPINRVKRFIHCYHAKQFGETFDDVIAGDECRVEMRWYTSKTWLKTTNPNLRAAGGKLGKVKHNIKANLFGAFA